MSKFPYKIIDLTHTLSPEIPTWDGSCGFEHFIQHDYDPNSIYKFRTHKVIMKEGIGTHIDAPAHCFAGAMTIDALPLVVLPCIVIDISSKAYERYIVSKEDMEAFETSYGKIEPNSFVLVRTGWDQFWNDPKKYINDHVFPSISEEAAKFLLERQIAGVGIDTLSPDMPDNGYPVHACLLGAGKFIVENVANSAFVPPRGSFIFPVPMKIQSGTEAPIRLVLFVCETP